MLQTLNNIALIITLFFTYQLFAQKDTVIYSPKGFIEYKGQIKDGQKEGLWIKYTSKGKIREKITYLPNNRFKTQVYKYQDSEILEQEYEGYLKTDKQILDGKYLMYFPKGISKEIQYQDGNRIGQSKTYYAEGGIKREENYALGMLNGKWVEYYVNGKVKESGNFDKGERIGKWQEFYENDQLKSEGCYYQSHTEIRYSENVVDSLKKTNTYNNYADETGLSFPIIVYSKDGDWKYYSEQSKLIKEETYKDGKLIDTKEYK